MLHKSPKPATRRWIKRGATILFVGEAIAFAVSYAIWYKVNTERDFRKYLHENHPSLLEAYYKVGETFDANCKIREIDHTYWKAGEH